MTIREMIQAMAKSGNSPVLLCRVTAVDEAGRLVDVDPVNGDAEILDVRLQLTEGNDAGAVAIPKTGELVLVLMVTEELGFVLLSDQITRYAIDVATTHFRFDDKGLAISSAAADFKTEINALIDLVDELLTTLQTFQVISAAPGAPSGPPAPTVLPKLVTAKTKLATLKQKINTVITEY